MLYFQVDHNTNGLLLTGKRNDDEGAKEKLFTYASHVVVTSFKVCISPLLFVLSSTTFSQGLQTAVVDAE